MITTPRNLIPVLALSASLGVTAISGIGVQEAHPGLKDDALKQALRKDRTHKSLDTLRARIELYLRVDNEDGWVHDRYTKTKIKAGKVPMPNEMWVEHTWPKSRLSNIEGHTDLHHLFPVSPVSNAMRRVLPFCDVRFPVWTEGGARVGMGEGKKMCFEPPADHKGDAARAMFYVSVMYEEALDPHQEKTLRAWHNDDKPDAREKRRNDRVQKAQESRNPFIDDPGLVKRISNF